MRNFSTGTILYTDMGTIFSPGTTDFVPEHRATTLSKTNLKAKIQFFVNHIVRNQFFSHKSDIYLNLRMSINPSVTRGEIRRLWETFIINKNRTLSFHQFVRHYGYSLRQVFNLKTVTKHSDTV